MMFGIIIIMFGITYNNAVLKPILKSRNCLIFSVLGDNLVCKVICMDNDHS